MSGGLLIAGLVVPVHGLVVLNPLDTPWCKLTAGDYRPRSTKWVRQIMIHTTKGKWPQAIRRGAGPSGADKIVADFWRKDPQHSAAQLVVDRDGSVACLCDLASTAAYHATTTNDWSIGIEMYQESDGSVYEAVYDATVKLVVALCDAFSIPFQLTADKFVPGSIIGRMLHGGKDCVGVFGHRDQAWMFPEQILEPERRLRYPTGYHARGRGDPGDEIYRRLDLAGAERFRYELSEDLATWKRRQRKLGLMGEQVAVDGIAGPGTMAALRRRGFATGRELDAARVPGSP